MASQENNNHCLQKLTSRHFSIFLARKNRKSNTARSAMSKQNNDQRSDQHKLAESFPVSIACRRISGASAIHERAREARGQKYDSGLALRARSRASRALSCIALAPLIRLFCRLRATQHIHGLCFRIARGRARERNYSKGNLRITHTESLFAG